MYKAFQTARARQWRYLATISLLLPVLICLLLAWISAQRLNANAGSNEAATVRHQIERILREAGIAVDIMMPQLARDCPSLQLGLARMASQRPYFRSLMMFEKQAPFCSSLLVTPLDSQQRWNLSFSRSLRVIENTPVAFSYPGLLLSDYDPKTDRHAVAVVDGQYLQDMIDSVAALDGHLIEVRIDGAPGFVSRPVPDGFVKGSEVELWKESFVAAGAHFVILVEASDRLVWATWLRLLAAFLPAALVIGLLLAWVLSRVQRQRLSFGEQIHAAMRAGEFYMAYQPVCEVQGARCAGVEALMRWERPGYGSVSPGVFIPAAEVEGAIVALTRHAMELIEKDWAAMGLPSSLHMGLNIAAEHLVQPTFPEEMLAFKQRLGPTGPKLVLELTERSMVEDTGRAQDNIARLRAGGMLVAIDDFGSGYCSLSYLQQFPVDFLKIDKVFVDAIVNAQQESPILDLILTLGQRLQLAVVAEGVTTPAQYTYLSARQVTYVQGYLIARPMAASVLACWYLRQGQDVMAGKLPDADENAGSEEPA
ncbi:EAL domain-containing protein [Bordetella trematum]|uniref:EAL domain-containing protein n=1 Tax=Bordetella trematum TaxID=123899 RepID=UPI0013FDDB93|nr:cyclic diguanylate phosphodiesterase [Bordetella trematum]